MKKKLSIALIGMMVFYAFFAFAENKKGEMTENKAMKGHHMAKHEKMMCPACSMMKCRTILVTPDGGVVIMIGNKLMKYDKNLVLKSEAEIKVDIEAMHKSYKEMCEKCKEACMKDPGLAAYEEKEESIEHLKSK